MEQVKVRFQQPIEGVQAWQMEGVQKSIFGVKILDVLVDLRALFVRSQLGAPSSSSKPD